jgi:phospholipase C
MNVFRFGFLALVLLLVACSGPGTPQAGGGTTPNERSASSPLRIGSYIKHVVIIIQENRTFDNIFDGFPGSYTARSGMTIDGTVVQLHPITFTNGVEPQHDWNMSLNAWNNGAMNGFNLVPLGTGLPAVTANYAYLERSQVAPYWAMAHQYTLADHMFPSEFGPSFTSHLMLVAGTTNIAPGIAEADSPLSAPWGCNAYPGTTTQVINTDRVLTWGGGPFPCFTQFKTLADPLDDAGIPWKYYAPSLTEYGGQLWSIFNAISKVRNGPDWQKVVSPPSQVLSDAASNDFPSVSWVVPEAPDSDHAGQQSDTGPSWVASVVNAIGTGPNWNTTAIVVLWDDWGGWYDNAPPPQLDFRGLGLRVPCIIISPYARLGYVSKTPYEFGSILKFVEEVFRLGPIGPESEGYTDTRATSILDSFDFTQPPHPFTVIPAKYPASFFRSRRPSLRPPDDD